MSGSEGSRHPPALPATGSLSANDEGGTMSINDVIPDIHGQAKKTAYCADKPWLTWQIMVNGGPCW